jgi:hypothetical protein
MSMITGFTMGSESRPLLDADESSRQRALLLSQFPEAWLMVAMILITGAGLWGQPGKQNVRTLEIGHGVKVSFPEPWTFANRTRNAVEITYSLRTTSVESQRKHGEKPQTAEELLAADARMAIEIESRRNHAEALERLAQIASEEPERPALVVIAGWPALERQRKAPLPNPGETESAGQPDATFVTTAIAADKDVIRFETVIAPGRDPKLADSALEIARNIVAKGGPPAVSQKELETISRGIVAPRQNQQKPTPVPTPAPTPESSIPPKGPGPSPTHPGATRVQNGVGELEVALSNDGLHVVVAANSGFSFSDDGGQTFTFGGRTPCTFNGCDGDPSLAVGKSGAIYYSWIGFPHNQPNGDPPDGATDSLSISTDNGHTFTFRSNAVVCPTATPTVCTTPDQEHIAADRTNSAPGGGDQVYLVWRNFSSVALTPRIVCSTDGALNWSAPTNISTAGDFPRINVGSDGSVYVVYRTGANLMLNKYSSCANGLAQQAGFPRQVSTVFGVVCPMPGLDRCNNGNSLSSHSVAVDDTNAQHLFVAYATITNFSGGGPEDVMIQESFDGGLNWSSAARVNTATVGRRFMPWVCSTNGSAVVSWYDRRSSTIDNTDYFVRVGTSRNGAIQFESEVNASNNPDPQCASGWPCAPRNTNDSESCSVQPQLAGICRPPLGSGSGNRCDFSAPACPAGETCQVGSGCPKYGDYNGNGCAAGNIVVAWASATSPSGLPAGTGIRIFASKLDAPPPPPIVNLGPIEHYSTPDGRFVRYHLPVTNWQAYPSEMFSPAPDLPPCGTNVNASRTWVDVYDASNNQRLYGFCALSLPKQLQDIWFAVSENAQPPNEVYVVVNDRRTNATYRSNVVSTRSKGGGLVALISFLAFLSLSRVLRKRRNAFGECRG